MGMAIVGFRQQWLGSVVRCRLYDEEGAWFMLWQLAPLSSCSLRTVRGWGRDRN